LFERRLQFGNHSGVNCRKFDFPLDSMAIQ